jgi:hypothetical protein
MREAMSRRIEAQTVKAMVQEPGQIPIGDHSSILASVHDVEMPFLKDSEIVCASPVCDIRFEPSGMSISPRRYCSDDCRQVASILKRAGKLLEGFSDEKAIRILGRRLDLGDISKRHTRGSHE